MMGKHMYDKRDNEFIAWYPCTLTPSSKAEVWKKRTAAYYIHIPFCTAICDYCGFAVEKCKNADIPRYLRALHKEINSFSADGHLSNHRFTCGHFGGGTPSVLSGEELVEIKDMVDRCFETEPDAEVTVEVNPISFTAEKARIYRKGGINRISFGLQTFNDRLLRVIGRPHRSEDVVETLEAIRGAGYDNYSLDLIYGIPSQTIDDLRNDLRRAMDTGATHLSIFRLEVIPLTVMHLRVATNDAPPMLENCIISEMEELIREELTAGGFQEYGVFNFCKPGYESVHNDIAFRAPQDDYVGFGNSSYSFINDHVYTNLADTADYVSAMEKTGDAVAMARKANAYELMSRYFVLGLKFLEVPRAEFETAFGLSPDVVFGDQLTRLCKEGMLYETPAGWRLSEDGKRYVNNVCKEFYVGENIGHRQHVQFVPTINANTILHYTKKVQKRTEAGV